MFDPARPDFDATPASSARPQFAFAPGRRDAAPAVSVITPFFDTDPEDFAETASSLRRQSLQQWEWLIVDDASTRRDSLAAVAEQTSGDARIRVLRHETNRGVSAARNTAAAAARAPYLLFLDSDDLIEPTTAEKWLWFLTSHPECAFVDAYVVAFGAESLLWPRGFYEAPTFLERNLVGGRCLIRRSVFEAVGGFDETMRGGFEDWDLWMRCAAAGYWGDTVPEYLAWHRRRGGDAARWPDWDEGPRQRAVREALEARYPALWKQGLPKLEPTRTREPEIELEAVPAENTLAKTKRRLLLIQPWAQVGGADKFNLDLVAQLNRHGWETTIATTLTGDHSWLPEFQRLTPDVFALMHFLKPEDYPRFLRYLVASRQPDAILIAHSLFAYKASPYLRRLAGPIPIADYCHIVEERWFDGGYPRMSVDYRDCIDLHVASSEALRGWMIDAGVDAERVEVCYTNVDPDSPPEAPSRAELGLPENAAVIVYPCRLSEQKQPDVFAKTMLELKRRGLHFVALAVGDGPYLPWLRGFVRRNRLGRHVRLLGSRPNAETQELIAAADCVFIPSTHEGVSLAFFEALAAGVAVVGADVGGQRELVTEDCGILVRRGKSDEEVRRYADALATLLGDPERCRAMGEAGRQRVRTHFTLSAMGERMDALLTEAARLAGSEPLPTPSELEARRAAVEAVRHVVAPGRPSPSQAPLSWRLRVALIRLLRALGLPVYRLCLRLGLQWVEPLKDRVFYAIVRKGA